MVGWISFSTTVRSVNANPVIDNIKIWNHVVSDSPDFEYNNGDGREDALHELYGPDNDYKPALDSTSDSGVGYYYMTQ